MTEELEESPPPPLAVAEAPAEAENPNGMTNGAKAPSPAAAAANGGSSSRAEQAAAGGPAVEITTVPWFRQFSTILWYKNLPLLQRKPVHVALMLLGSVASVLLAWAAGRDGPADNKLPPLTDCGTIDSSYFDGMSYDEQIRVPLSLNESWRNSLPVAVLSLGPMLTAICAFLIVHAELQLHMLGVLRGGLGMRDSVYWASWYVPLAVIAFLNSLLAAITAKTLPVHVFEATYFGGILASFFFVQLALIGSSLFFAAVSGTARRGAVWLILIMVAALWIPYLIIVIRQPFGVTAYDVTSNRDAPTPTGLFWVNQQTTIVYQDYNPDTGNSTTGLCDFPIMSHEEGHFFKTDAQRQAVTPDSFFIGCFAAAGWNADQWAPTSKTNFGLAVLWFFPYFHFYTMWGNFAGFTAMEGIEFNANHASLTAGELAREALPVVPSEDTSGGTTLFPQGSMLQLEYSYDYQCETENSFGGCETFLNNCPANDLEGFGDRLCPFEGSNQCVRTPNPSPAEGMSVNAMIGMLLALSLIYVLMAAYWGIVFVGGPGTHSFCFVFQPSYWCGTKPKNGGYEPDLAVDAEVGAAGAPGAIQVNAVRKTYGSVEAVRDVSLQMARGEVTAILGHNGAGKTTLVNVLTCEVPPSAGDITVFGHSVKDDPYAVRRLVGVCKQDDYLYPNLTAKEHLDLFAGLRGVDAEQHDAIVQRWLESVDLDTVQHQYASQYSGGMKRRLSLALSTIGERPLIVLDEPTTG